MSATLFTRSSARPAVIAHRGSGPGVGPGGHRENTVGAVLWAVANGADWVEIDVQASADGDLVLYHNVLLDGRAIGETSTRELVDAGLCTLTEVHEQLPDHIGMNLDVKVGLLDATGDVPDLFARVSHWAAAVASSRRLLVTSFCPTVARPACPVPVGLLRGRSSWYYESVAAAVRMGAEAVAVHAADVVDVPRDCPGAEEVARFARDRDLAVLAWGVVPADVAELAARGVTGLCGDDVPGIAAAVADLSAGTGALLAA